MRYEEYLRGLDELKKNEWYWQMDNQYNQYYKTLCDENCHDWAHKYSIMAAMLPVSKKLFG